MPHAEIRQPAFVVLAKSEWGDHAVKMVRSGSLTPFPSADECVSFHRTELSVIMGLYGQMVAAGLWRDYGISMLKDVAIFSIFRHTAEFPIYRIEKNPKMAAKQQQYSVLGMDGRILKRGSDLKTVLRVLDKKLIRSV